MGGNVFCVYGICGVVNGNCCIRKYYFLLYGYVGMEPEKDGFSKYTAYDST